MSSIQGVQGVANLLPVTQGDPGAKQLSPGDLATQLEKALTDLPDKVADADKPLVQLNRDANGYTITLDIQKTAAAGKFSARVDAGLVESVLTAMAGARDGRISVADVHKYLEPALRDGVKGNKYAEGEKPVVQALMSAFDGRVKAQLGDKRINWAGEGAERAFLTVVRSVIGHDAAVARWAKQADVSLVKHPVQQSS